MPKSPLSVDENAANIRQVFTKHGTDDMIIKNKAPFRPKVLWFHTNEASSQSIRLRYRFPRGDIHDHRLSHTYVSSDTGKTRR